MKTVWFVEGEWLGESLSMRAFSDCERALSWALQRFAQHDASDKPRIVRHVDSIVVSSTRYYDLLVTITPVVLDKGLKEIRYDRPARVGENPQRPEDANAPHC